ncbi:MAG TPA: TetR family transcriptional regulator [Kineosporiaceae bacterium]|nr:TetR family transcriptional regulator [Kineosporiaceae bacterium]
MATTVPTLTAERILDVTEEVLRRHGPAKATVMDVARALDVSHASLYRHFPSKTALQEAVTKRWLDRTCQSLADTAAEDRDPPTRLRDWITGLSAAKRRKAADDPELFGTYLVLAGQTREVVGAHLANLIAQLTRIIEAGVATGAFTTPDPPIAARAIFQATVRFHHPIHAKEWQQPGIEKDLDAVLDLVLQGLRYRER